MQTQRLELLDSHIRERFNLLIEVEFLNENFAEEEIAKDLTDLIGNERVGLFVSIADIKGKILFQNDLAEAIGLSFQDHEGWNSSEWEDNYVRYYTQRFEAKKRTMSVGLALNPGNEPYFFPGFPWIIAIPVFFLCIIISYLLTNYLVRPINSLADSLERFNERLTYQDFEKIDELFITPRNKLFFQKDELERLIKTLKNIVIQISNLEKANIHHAARVVHELNTPISLLKIAVNELQSTTRQPTDIERLKKQMDSSLNKIEIFVRDYLEWVESVSLPLKDKNIYAINMESFLKDFMEEISPVAKDRIELRIENNLTVLADTKDLSQIINNLVINALKYSPHEKGVELLLTSNGLTIRDHGGGIPSKVLKNLGQPFNKGDQPNAIGLGLSLVTILASKYNWKINYNNAAGGGTEIKIDFGEHV